MNTHHPSNWYTLSDRSKWWFSRTDAITFSNDEWTFLENKGIKAEVGGMSWQNYILSTEIFINRKSSNSEYQVQLTAAGTNVYCQLMPTCIVLAYFNNSTDETDHFGVNELSYSDNTWHTFEMIEKDNIITAIFNGKEIISNKCPQSTIGMPGLLVGIKNADIRMRNIKIQFLKPTEIQLKEYENSATVNWENYQKRAV